ncbi:bifunctional protein-serine/threonine kinase/phosphatase [Oceanicoccus sp. KOV_DT_Chl]|uniref:bifunctional protein-serine/threonine kinase/phosphatase n=1 Tax=Oceanicoccus sp. KOV_DT_Chl TaxID=1904639 RepID=UPI000C7C9C11|nr:bifunctional protein-serine/threonine kinase/phosphatase [Oceanicoccus sp. KOV_DT_Chl]
MNAPDLHLQSLLQLSVGQATNAGVKSVNEDSIGIRIPDGSLLTTKGAVALIADGVSAAEGGREASETCVQNFLTDYFSTPESWTVKKSAQRVLTALNRWLYGQSQRFSGEHKGYLTTLSCMVFKSHNAHIFHVGDSRIYRFRNGAIEQLTRDHALAISAKQTYLTRAMGLDVKLDVDYRSVNLELGDIYILTTDGIHDFVSDKKLIAIINDNPDDYEDACQKILALARASHSDDNLSCQIVRVDNLPKQEVNDVVSKLTALPFPPFLSVGSVIDGLTVVRELYASTRSQLYLVADEASGKQYCMKTPSVNFEDDPAYIERFVMESWIGSRINNVHVVKVVDRQQRKSCLYYLTEYISGLTLTQWMKENPKPPVEEVVYLVGQIAKGIRAFHRRETLHQDIKPDNIIIDKNGVVKILDFGSCHVAGIAEIDNPLQQDIALGTASYSAPEHILKKSPTYQADTFSLAVISYEMLTGQLPFSGKLESCKTSQDFLNTKYTPSYQLNPLVPVWIDGALKKSLRFSPERRHQDIPEFIHELQHPNEKYLAIGFRPLVEKDPVLFWKLVAGILLVTQLVTGYFLLP